MTLSDKRYAYDTAGHGRDTKWHMAHMAALDHRLMRNQARKPSSGTAPLRTAVRPHCSLQRWTPVPVRPPDAAHDDARSRRRPVSRLPPPAAAATPATAPAPRLRTPSQAQDLMGGWRRIPFSAICGGAPEPRSRWNLPSRDLGGSPTRDPAQLLLADRDSRFGGAPHRSGRFHGDPSWSASMPGPEMTPSDQ